MPGNTLLIQKIILFPFLFRLEISKNVNNFIKITHKHNITKK